MSNKLKKVIALVGGYCVCVAVVALMEFLTHAIFGLHADFSQQDAAAAHAYLQSLPFLAYCFVLLAWMLGTFFGIWAARIFYQSMSRIFVPTITALMVLSTLANFYLLPHPLWFVILTLAILPLTGYLTGRWLQRGGHLR